MTTASETETKQHLEADLRLEAEQVAQIGATDAELAQEQAERQRLTAVRGATHAEVTALKACHDALAKSKHDASIDGTETDSVAAVLELQASAGKLEFCIGKLRRITEDRLPALNIKVLTVQKKQAVLKLALAGTRLRVHNSRVLLAVLPAGEIGGDLTIKSAVAQRLGHEEAQAAYDLEQIVQALETEIERQKRIRDARASGPISYVNP